MEYSATFSTTDLASYDYIKGILKMVSGVKVKDTTDHQKNKQTFNAINHEKFATACVENNIAQVTSLLEFMDKDNYLLFDTENVEICKILLKNNDVGYIDKKRDGMTCLGKEILEEKNIEKIKLLLEMKNNL